MKKIFIYIMLFHAFGIMYGQSFVDVAAAKGITTGCGFCGVGCGLSFVDFNGDGLDDLTFATQEGSNLLFYENNGNGFTLIPAPITNTDKNEQVLWVDYDNDGDRDLFVTNFMRPNRLYQNDGNLNLTEVTVAAGLPLLNDPTYGAVFGDYDNNGWLDLYISNWSFMGVHANFLFKNEGDGTFTDVTNYTQTGDADNLTFCSAFIDINNNGWQDLYNSQDRFWSPNSMFRNDGSGIFADISTPSNTNLAIDAMNVGVGDYDNDGDLDIYITNTPSQGGNKMLRNEGDETFTEVASEMGVSFDKVGWGGNFFDCDNDMDLDLYVCAMHEGINNSNELYLNQNAGSAPFIEANLPGMVGDTLNSFANAIGDYNQDGLPDIAVNNATPIGNPTTHKFHLWENQTNNSNNYLKINLEGVESNREGIGSWIECYINDNKYVRYKHCGIAYLAQNSTTELIGLGSHTIVDSIIIRWLSGYTNTLYNVSANQTLDIVEDVSSPLPVEWLYFTARAGEEAEILLSWGTTSEINNKGFEVQRSTDGYNFQSIGWINAKGIPATYDFSDSEVKPHIQYYYRLKQVDEDDRFSFSKVVSVKTESDSDLIVEAAYPNPLIEGQLTIPVLVSQQALLQLSIYHLNGQLVRTKQISVDPGNNLIDFSLDDLTNGVYMLRIQSEHIFHHQKITVVRN